MTTPPAGGAPARTHAGELFCEVGCAQGHTHGTCSCTAMRNLDVSHSWPWGVGACVQNLSDLLFICDVLAHFNDDLELVAGRVHLLDDRANAFGNKVLVSMGWRFVEFGSGVLSQNNLWRHWYFTLPVCVCVCAATGTIIFVASRFYVIGPHGNQP